MLLTRITTIILVPGAIDRLWPYPDRFSPELVTVWQILERPQTTILLLLFAATMALLEARRTGAAMAVAALVLLLPVASLIASLCGVATYGLMSVPTTLGGIFGALALLLGNAHRTPLRQFLTKQAIGRQSRYQMALVAAPFVTIALMTLWSGPNTAVRWLPVLATILVGAIGFVLVEGRLQLARIERQRKTTSLRPVAPLQRAMRGAWMRGEFFLVYQPQIDLTSQGIVGAEALVRWEHPTDGLLGPDRFIPIAEESGMIVPLGAWILAVACEEAVGWSHDAGLAGASVSVNVSPTQLREPTFTASVIDILHRTGLPPHRLILEVTESVLVHESDDAIKALTDLRDAGIRIAIDDFGTGYSSLSYLRRLPIDYLKIDRSFVSELPADQGSVAIARALLAMGQGLGMQIIAEGIETLDQADFLKGLGCDEGQGYFYSRPIRGDELLVLSVNRQKAKSVLLQ